VRIISTITGVLLGFAAVNSTWAQTSSTTLTPSNVEIFSPIRWSDSHWVHFFHEDLNDAYYTYKATNYVANYDMKNAIRGKDGRYAVVTFVDGQVRCDPLTGARTQIRDLGDEAYRVSDGVRFSSSFGPEFERIHGKLVPGSYLDIVTKAVCTGVLAARGSSHG
jgi:hypothetical protein